MINFLRTTSLASLLAFWTFQPPLWANGESDDELYETDQLEHVQVTATRTRERDFDISAAVTGIDEEEMLKLAPDVISEMLRGQPGTFFQQTTPGQGIPIIRGLKGSQILHLVDGMRLNNAFFRSAPNQYLGLVDSFAVRRMEVVRGAQGTLYGADAMGGVVNIMTPEPWITAGCLMPVPRGANGAWALPAVRPTRTMEQEHRAAAKNWRRLHLRQRRQT